LGGCWLEDDPGYLDHPTAGEIRNLSSKTRSAIAVLAVVGGMAVTTGAAEALAPARVIGVGSPVSVFKPPATGSARYVNGTGSEACQAATNAANSWQAAGTQADLNGDYDEASKDYKYADTIAGAANAGPNDCVIYEPEA